MNGVLKFVVLPKQHLRPAGPRIREEPARVMFSLDDEEAKPGDQNVIDLGRAIVYRQRHIVEKMVRRRIEMSRQQEPNSAFASIRVEAAPPTP